MQWLLILGETASLAVTSERAADVGKETVQLVKTGALPAAPWDAEPPRQQHQILDEQEVFILKKNLWIT